jgi:hypothetical protein
METKTMVGTKLERYARRLGLQRPDVQRILSTAEKGENAARIAESVLRAKLRRAGVNPDDNSPFRPAISAEALGGSGIVFGSLADSSGDLIWRFDELPYSAIFTGSPGQGKTTLVIKLIVQLSSYCPIVVVDVRGDYECLQRLISNSRFFVFGSFPINLIRGPSNVPPQVFNQRFSQVFTEELQLFESSRRYLNKTLDLLDEKRVMTGHWPCLLDLLDQLENQKEDAHSNEKQFRDRCVARVDMIKRALGVESVGVESGIDIEGLIQIPQTIVFRLELEQSLADFLTSWLLMYVFEHKTWKENKFNQMTTIVVLDEHRSLLLKRI